MVPVHGKGGWQRIASVTKWMVTQWRERVQFIARELRSVHQLVSEVQVLSPERLSVPIASDHFLYYAPTDHPFRARRRQRFVRND